MIDCMLTSLSVEVKTKQMAGDAFNMNNICKYDVIYALMHNIRLGYVLLIIFVFFHLHPIHGESPTISVR